MREAQQDITTKVAPPSVAEKLSMAVVLAGLLWLGVCVVSSAWLFIMVPISSQDIAHASWLGSYTTATHFAGALSYALIGACLLVSGAMVLAKSSPILFVPGALVAASILMAGSEGIMVRIGIAFDSVKIGCYVYESRECHEMLGVSTDGVLSRYSSAEGRGRDEVNASWYVKALGPRSSSLLDMMPGGYLVRAPLLLGREAELNNKIASQRAEVAQLRLGAVQHRN